MIQSEQMKCEDSTKHQVFSKNILLKTNKYIHINQTNIKHTPQVKTMFMAYTLYRIALLTHYSPESLAKMVMLYDVHWFRGIHINIAVTKSRAMVITVWSISVRTYPHI